MKNQLPFRIGKYIVEPQHYCMYEGDRSIPLSKRHMHLLVFLSQQNGKVATKEAMLENVWKTVLVSDETIRKTISDLRMFFQQEDCAIEIESVRGIGYRLLTPIEPVVKPQQQNYSRQLGFVSAILILLTAAIGYWFFTKKEGPSQLEETLNRGTITTSVRSAEAVEKVVYSAKAIDDAQLIVHDLSKSDQHLVEDVGLPEPEGTFSPDGQSLVYIGRHETEKVLKLRFLKTKKEEVLLKLGRTPALASLDWSATGNKVIYSQAAPDGPYQLYELDLSTKATSPITYPAADNIGDMQGRYSPSGKQLSFIRYSRPAPFFGRVLPGYGQLYVKDLESGAEIPLLDREMIIGACIWLDENKLAYVARDFYTFGIHIINLQNREKETIYTSALALRNLMRWKDQLWTEQWQEPYSFKTIDSAGKPDDLFTVDFKCWHPAYSPDGTQLAYVVKGEQGYELRLRNTADGEEEVLFAAPMLIQVPQWSPNGDALVFILEGSEPGVCTFEMASKRVTPLAKGEYPIWDDTGQTVIYIADGEQGRTIFSQSTQAGSEAEAILQLSANRAVPFQSDWLYTRKEEDGLWRYHTGTQTHELLISNFLWEDAPNWSVQGEELFFWQRNSDKKEHLTFRQLNLETGKETTLSEVSHFFDFFYSGFTVHPSSKNIVYPTERFHRNELIPVALPSDE